MMMDQLLGHGGVDDDGNITPKITGILHNAVWLPDGTLKGEIYDNHVGALSDGTEIITTGVTKVCGDIYSTRFANYKVESWRSKDAANDNEPPSQTTVRRIIAINELASYFHMKSAKAGWWKDGNGMYVMATKLALIHSEVSEAMEGLRKDVMDDKLPHRKMMEVELADAVIRIFDLAGACGFDLGGAIMEKDAFNARRADHKPEARAAAGGKAF